MKKAFLLLALLIFVVGCIGSTGVRRDANNGLTVNEFSADPLDPSADDAVRLFLDVENVGGTTANCVTSEIFGVDSWRDQFGVPLSRLYGGAIIPSRGLFFNYNNGNFNVCYSDYTQSTKGNICVSRVKGMGVSLSGFIGNSFLDFTNQYCNSFISANSASLQQMSLVKYQPSLIPPDPAVGRAGQSQTFEWILRPPVLPEGASAPFPVTARTSYFYSTNSIMNVQAFSSAEFDRIKNKQPTTYPLTIQNSFGSPIQIFATRGSSPIIVDTDATPYSGPIQYESYKFDFANMGEGFPLPMSGVDQPSIYSPETQGGFIAAVMSVQGPGVFFSDCLGQGGQGVTDVFITPNAIQSLVKLRSDQRVPIGCTIGIDRQQWATNPIGTVSFKFSLWYRYYIDKTVSVTVRGAQGLPGSVVVGNPAA